MPITEKRAPDSGKKLVKKEESLTRNEFKKTLKKTICEDGKTKFLAATGGKSYCHTL